MEYGVIGRLHPPLVLDENHCILEVDDQVSLRVSLGLKQLEPRHLLLHPPLHLEVAEGTLRQVLSIPSHQVFVCFLNCLVIHGLRPELLLNCEEFLRNLV